MHPRPITLSPALGQHMLRRPKTQSPTGCHSLPGCAPAAPVTSNPRTRACTAQHTRLITYRSASQELGVSLIKAPPSPLLTTTAGPCGPATSLSHAAALCQTPLTNCQRLALTQTAPQLKPGHDAYLPSCGQEASATGSRLAARLTSDSNLPPRSHSGAQGRQGL